jgi:hypothetical protein
MNLYIPFPSLFFKTKEIIFKKPKPFLMRNHHYLSLPCKPKHILCVGLSLSLCLILSSCFKTREQEVINPVVTDEQAVATQQIVNHFFHTDIIPKIDSTWNAMPDSGKSVVYHYVFLRKDSTWHFNSIETDSSDLSERSDSIALSIMSAALVRSSFPVEERLAKDSAFHLFWIWPIPFPEGEYDTTKQEFIARLNTGGGNRGGCDGYGVRARCTMCGTNNDCPLVCVGSLECDNQADGSCWAMGVCASGGPFRRTVANLIQ